MGGARVVLLAGPSGCGKSSMARRLGLPTVHLDDFYLDAGHPGLPRRHGIVDWDSPACWDADGAAAALVELCRDGRAEMPVYDIPTSRRTASSTLELDGATLVIAEGIFAAELVAPMREAGLLADALALSLPRWRTFWRRLARDLGEGRKPPITLARRGLSLAREEPAQMRTWVAQGCRQMSPQDAERALARLARSPDSDARTPGPAQGGSRRSGAIPR